MMDIENHVCSFKNLELPEEVCLRRKTMNIIKDQMKPASRPEPDSSVYVLDHDELIQISETSHSLAEIYAVKFTHLTSQHIDMLKSKNITHVKFYTSYAGMWLPYRQGEFEPLDKFLAPSKEYDAEIVIVMLCLLCVVVLMLYPYLFR